MLNYHENRLFTDEGDVLFSQPISAILEMQDKIVVLLKYAWGSMEEDNIFGVKGGQIIWRIQPQQEFNPHVLAEGLPQKNPYSGIRISKKEPSLLLAGDLSGYRYLVDSATGKIVGEEKWDRWGVR